MANYFIVDGGGTTTRGWLVTSDGTVLTHATAGPSNVARFGAEALDAALQTIIRSCPGAESAEKIVCGLAGVGRDRERGIAESVAKELWPSSKIKIVTDAHLMYAGAFCKGEHGILLIIGTGSIAMYQNPHGHEFFRAGGWGPLLGDEGSGAWIGREALRLCLRESERAELSPFHAAVLDKLGIDASQDIITKVYREDFGPTRWAELAPLVFDFANVQHDVIDILERAVLELIDQVERLIDDMTQHEAALPLVCSGGLWERRDLLEPIFREEIILRNLPLKIAEPDGGAVEGGLSILQSL
jgi:glucosamine kinase